MMTPNAFNRRPMMGMLPSFPFITIFINVGNGGNVSSISQVGKDECAQVHFQDLTKATGHKEPTRFFHMMFDDDPDMTERVWDLLSTDYRNFYYQLLTAELEEAPGKIITNPLELPPINSDIEDEFVHLQDYLAGLRHSPICAAPSCPCSSLLVTETSVGQTAVCHPTCPSHNMP